MNLHATSPTRQIETSTPGPAAGGEGYGEGRGEEKGGGGAQEVGRRK